MSQVHPTSHLLRTYYVSGTEPSVQSTTVKNTHTHTPSAFMELITQGMVVKVMAVESKW